MPPRAKAGVDWWGGWGQLDFGGVGAGAQGRSGAMAADSSVPLSGRKSPLQGHAGDHGLSGEVRAHASPLPACVATHTHTRPGCVACKGERAHTEAA